MTARRDSRLTDHEIEQLRRLETDMWQAPTRADRGWMDAHLAPGFTEFGRSGRRYTRREILDIEIGEIDVEIPWPNSSFARSATTRCW